MQTQPTTNPLTTAQPPDNNHLPTPPINALPLAPNNSPSPAPSRLPKARHWSRRSKWLLAGLVLLTASGTGLAGWYFYRARHTARPDLILHAIEKKMLYITITERGSLEPADNTYFPCKVKAKTPGGAATSIRWVIDNGSFVKEGDNVIELDDSALKDQLGDRLIAVYNAETALTKAKSDLDLGLLTDEALVKTNETNLKVAEITLEEYLHGTFVQNLLDLNNKLAMAGTDDFMWAERAKWSDRMSRPGQQFVTVSQAESDAARHKTSQLTLTSLLTQKKVLEDLTKERFRVQYQGAIDEARRQVKKAQETLQKDKEKNEGIVRTAEAVYQKELSRLHDLETEIADCVIRAPRDGMVVYYVEERARFGASQGGVIAQGEQVKEGQKLLNVPDLTQMVVNARVHEAVVSRVRDDKVKQTGFSKIVKGLLAFTPQPLDGLSAYAAFDLELQSDFSSKHAALEKLQEQRGLPATVRVNAFPDRPLKAHVKWVSPVASQNDFFASDVKVYQTYIAIDDDRLEGLKPGMDAVVTIKVDSTPEPVLQIPLQALLGSVDLADKRSCFVVVDGHLEKREITLGKANETVAEVKDGLKEGDVVVLNPAALLSDKEKAQYGLSASSNQGGQGGQGGPGMGQGGRGRGPGSRSKGPGSPPGSPGTPGGRPSGGGGRTGQGGSPPAGKAAANP
jgi:multidrug resistance efflux pump